MFLIDDETVDNLLKEDYKYLKTIYKQDRILGLFTYGKLNYGFAENISEIKVKMYYLPSLEEMCTSTEWKDEMITHNNHTIDIKDIRLILKNIIDQEGVSMECFYSKHYIITPKFKTVFMDNIIAKREEISANIDNITIKKYTELISSTITTCVIATNQTYVEALKKSGKFDEEAQKLAFEQTKTAVLEILTEDAKEYLTEFYGDLDKQLNSLIEAEVNKNK